MAEKRDFTFKVNRDGHAESAEITYDYHRDMLVTLKGVDSGDVANMLTMEEFVGLRDLEGILKALVAKHGMAEVVTELTDISGSGIHDVLDILYDYSGNDVRDWVTDNLGNNE